MKNTSILLCVFLCSFSCKKYNSNQIREIDKVLVKLHKENQFNGNVLIAQKGNIIYEKSFGYSNIEKKIPLKSSSIFNIASVSKTFTVVGIMMLVQENKLQLDEKVCNYLPKFPYKNISIRHLLTHTSGLVRIQSQPFKKEIEGKQLSNINLVNKLIEIAPKLYFLPGTDYFYSNTNYNILAHVLEKTTKLNFNIFLKDRIFKKLKMKNTFLGKKNVPRKSKSEIVSNYTKTEWLSNVYDEVSSLDSSLSDITTFGNTYGHSLIHTTTQDLLKFHNALINNSLLDKDSQKEIYKSFKLTNSKEYVVDKESNYPSYRGLGWCIARENPNVVYHAGGIIGSRSFFISNIEKDLCVIILSNNDEMGRYNFTFPMRILEGKNYNLDSISMPKLFARTYIKEGLNKALEKYHRYKNSKKNIPFITWDFEEIGAELISKNDINAAVELYKLYTAQFPKEEYSWSLLADAYLLNKDTANALINYRKALKIRPNFKEVLSTINKIKKI
ncbi:serine hydrolase domain-containing protein [Polaribacter porphyrae]|uniref:serine hydrolase domain-containing protein n=1 Tax=Polaribacter porphyrae TaxID=1137780 RepID=UPI0014763A91|nr:serine hydrolase domain-containing protein [Polaribacter porphyrae]